MPAKIHMYINNGNMSAANARSIASPVTPQIMVPKNSSALNASIIGRIHTVKPGCGSCGRH